MATEAQIAEARRLRAEGMGYKDIAAALNTPQSTVYRWVNVAPASYSRTCEHCGEQFVAKSTLARFCPPPKRCRRQHHEASLRAACQTCGATLGAGSATAGGRTRSTTCADCLASIRPGRAMEMLRLRRDERLENQEIAQRLGVAPNTVAAELSRLRTIGFDVPLSAYARKRGWSQRASWIDRDCETLARGLAHIGVEVPRAAPQRVAA
jgi:DNA-directed RNA polymerase specialized sigma24 family protein